MDILRLLGAVVAASVLWLAGCAHTASAPLRIDGSSPAAFQASWDRMHRSLTRQQQAQLDVAILLIAFGPYKRFSNVPPALLAGGWAKRHSTSNRWDDVRADCGVCAERTRESEVAGRAVSGWLLWSRVSLVGSR